MNSELTVASGDTKTENNHHDSFALPLVLPFSRPSEPDRALDLQSVPVKLPADTIQQILNSAADPAALFLSVWSVLLWRYTDQSEIAFGVVNQDRSVLPLRIHFTDEILFSEVVRQVEEAKRKPEQNLSASNARHDRTL